MYLSLLTPSATCRRWAIALLAATLLLATASSQAQTIYGLGTITGSNFRNEPVGSQGLILINPTTGAAQTLAPVRLTGVTAGQTLVGIDFRPADNLLYGLGYDAALAGPANNAQVYLVNPGTNVATPVGSAIRLELGTTTDGIGFDFNPTVDRIRVVSANDANYRLNPVTGGIVDADPVTAGIQADGNLSYSGGSPANPGVGTAAYTNSFVGSASTTLYDIDYINGGILSIQNPPNLGTLNTQSTLQLVVTGGSSPGTYTVGAVRHLGLDIYYNPNDNTNVGYFTLVSPPRAVFGGTSRASDTYRLDLSTGVATQLANTVPASSFINLEIRDLAIALAPIPDLTWNGSTSTDWRTAANWTPALVPGPANNVTIPGGTPFQPTINQAQQTNAFTLSSGATLTLPSNGYLVVGGDFINNGTFNSSGTGTVVMNLNVNQVIGGSSATQFENLIIGTGNATLATSASLAGPASVHGLLTLAGGNLTVTGQTFTLLSDAAGTAMVYNAGSGVVNGPVTVQRYIAPNLNGGPGYRHYSPPVSGSTVADLSTAGFVPVLNTAYNSAAQPGLVTPFPNVFSYDQGRVGTVTSDYNFFDQGWQSPGGTGDALNVTQGYTVNINAAAKVDFVGPLNNGPYTASGLGRGSNGAAGWHLRGNPYPAPLDWQLIINNGGLSSIDPALYVYKSSGQYTGSFASYINGMGTNGGTNLLPSAQAFFVRTSAVGASGSINFTNNERLTTYANPAFQRSAADLRPQLTLSLNSASASTQTVAYFQQGATAAFDAQFDAAYLPNLNGLTLATEAGAEPLAINGLPALTGQNELLPLRLAAAPGSYILHVDALRNLPTGYHAYLRDALTGTFTDLAATPSLPLTLAANAPAAGRYALLFTTQARVLATAPQELAQLVSVYPNPAHGTATLVLPAALRGAQATQVQVLDNLGRVVLTRTLAAGATEALQLPLGTLNAGIYTVQARTAVGLVAKRLVVQ
ncbi:DUF4394 domain-containing protein [Hymenobacter sp. ASUV-10]|uniref:DUF4394 domain-containing protein n=1 Tax=Hymenobacter aranciens TaxID=3063996 RepID=A0ABT9BBY6_9BACT|nr:DUF4394 domain-containing protein [Hymenobacter sp. ASUV-10]MDO7875779.1 DUF4394 domain-containing protein [Hymenobacter sp. ASUV-10]